MMFVHNILCIILYQFIGIIRPDLLLHLLFYPIKFLTFVIYIHCIFLKKFSSDYNFFFHYHMMVIHKLHCYILFYNNVNFYSLQVPLNILSLESTMLIIIQIHMDLTTINLSFLWMIPSIIQRKIIQIQKMVILCCNCQVILQHLIFQQHLLVIKYL